MPQELVTLYAFTLSICEALMADISQEEMEHQPAAGVNTPAWILGHLAICTDFALMFLGQPMRLPKSWHEEFGPQSSPQPKNPPYPSREGIAHGPANWPRSRRGRTPLGRRQGARRAEPARFALPKKDAPHETRLARPPAFNARGRPPWPPLQLAPPNGPPATVLRWAAARRCRRRNSKADAVSYQVRITPLIILRI